MSSPEPVSQLSIVTHARHPNVRIAAYRETSERTETYNCVAWALGVTDRWIDTSGLPGTFWPSGVSAAGDHWHTYAELFLSRGFEPCDTSEHEPGFEKVAIYGIEEEFTHVARQLSETLWTSKLGALQDIEHPSPTALEDAIYGTVQLVLRRPVRDQIV